MWLLFVSAALCHTTFSYTRRLILSSDGCLSVVVQDVSDEMTSQLLLDRLSDDVVEVVDAVLTLTDVRCVLISSVCIVIIPPPPV